MTDPKLFQATSEMAREMCELMDRYSKSIPLSAMIGTLEIIKFSLLTATDEQEQGEGDDTAT